MHRKASTNQQKNYLQETQDHSRATVLDFSGLQQAPQVMDHQGALLQDERNEGNYVNTMISPKVLNFIFVIIFSTNLMINVDHGILPACTKEVKRDLHLDNANLGLLGSLVYVGLVMGKNYRLSK